jgi:nucleoside-triphosphatase
LPPHISLNILVRSMIIVLTWYFVVSPMVKELLHWWLRKRRSKSQPEIQKVLELLPDTQQLAAKSWKLAGKQYQQKKGWARLIATGKTILINAMHTDITKQVVLLNGAKQTGKTTSLVIWSQGRTDVSGILTPAIDGKRFFMNAKTREVFPMEAVQGESQVMIVGKYAFSKKGFDRAVEIIKEGIKQDGWLVIDEIGPMELRGEGFDQVLQEVLEERAGKQSTLLVVREGLAEDVKRKYKIENSIQIGSVAALQG